MTFEALIGAFTDEQERFLLAFNRNRVIESEGDEQEISNSELESDYVVPFDNDEVRKTFRKELFDHLKTYDGDEQISKQHLKLLQGVLIKHMKTYEYLNRRKQENEELKNSLGQTPKDSMMPHRKLDNLNEETKGLSTIIE